MRTNPLNRIRFAFYTAVVLILLCSVACFWFFGLSRYLVSPNLFSINLSACQSIEKGERPNLLLTVSNGPYQKTKISLKTFSFYGTNDNNGEIHRILEGCRDTVFSFNGESVIMQADYFHYYGEVDFTPKLIAPYRYYDSIEFRSDTSMMTDLKVKYIIDPYYLIEARHPSMREGVDGEFDIPWSPTGHHGWIAFGDPAGVGSSDLYLFIVGAVFGAAVSALLEAFLSYSILSALRSASTPGGGSNNRSEPRIDLGDADPGSPLQESDEVEKWRRNPTP